MSAVGRCCWSLRSAVCMLMFTLCCVLPLHTLAQLEPGEVVTDESGASASPTAAALQLAETAAGAAVARCDAIQSRKARSIVKEMFLSQLPPSYTLPSSCPFHPSLDLLSKLDENPGGALKSRLGGGMVRCGTCGKRFQAERFVDEHIQRRHMQQEADEPFVCLADYCDVLDCFHRGVQLDALTGEVMTEGRAGALHGSAGGRQRRLQLANQARNRERQQARTSADMAAASAPLLVEHPQARRCSEQSMALARARCASVLQRCFPFHGSDAADPAAPSGEEVHMLYERFHADFCVPLHCTAEGAHANAHAVVATKAAESRARLYWILVALLLVAIGLFYFFAFQLRHEFGWKPSTTAGGGSFGSALTRPAHLKARQQNRLAAWLGMQQKRSVSKIQ